jgi:uncharacterized protein (DUF1778 family)
MSSTEGQILDRLNAERENLIQRVALHLTECIPNFYLSQATERREDLHRHNMVLTAQRLHDIIQAGVALDWALVEAEFGWAGRKLSQFGLRWEQQQVMIEVYFAEVQKIRVWLPAEQELLAEIKARLIEVGQKAFVAGQEKTTEANIPDRHY